MRLRAIIRILLLFPFVLFLFGFHSSVFAQAVDDDVEFRYHYYKDNSGLTVTSPSIAIRKNISEQTGIILKYTYETFEFSPTGSASSGGSGGSGGEHDHGKPSQQKTLSAVDAVSGASALVQGSGGGFKEVRKEMILSLLHRREQTTFGGTYATSDEDDYRSRAYGLSISRDLRQKNTNLYLDYSHAKDEVDNLNKALGEEWPRDKETDSGTVALTQILSPTSYFRVGYGIANVEGYLASPYRIVRIKATDFDEVHPDTRLRQSFYAWYNRYFKTRTSSHINGSYYRDDWGINAYSAELKLYQYLSDPLTLRLRYRHYNQTKADFFDVNRTRPSAIMSADPKLRDFNTDLYGLKLIYHVLKPPVRFIDRLDLELAYDRLEEPRGFHADLGQFVFRILY